MADIQEEIKQFEQMLKWPQFHRLIDRPVAYFCAEYALAGNQRLYSGGLGILAGDYLREAQDRGLPLVAVGLYYKEGYVCKTREVGGRVMEICETTPPEKAGFSPVMEKGGDRLHVVIPIHDRVIKLRAWSMKLGSVTLYLLDTDCEENSPEDQRITDRLYVGDKETRLKQEIVLGIGGLRLLESLDIHPSLYHLNEGHSAFLALELVRHEMAERHIGFDEAKQFARRRIVMTNHTLVPAGNEVFSNDLVSMMLDRYAEDLSVPVHELSKIGLVQQSSEFSMSMLAFRMASIINAVSRLHAKKAKEIWTDHPMVAITNGVHTPTWDRVGAETGKGAFWKRHQELKKELLGEVERATGRKWSADHLLIGWARRTVQYKRPLAAFEDAARLTAIARREDRPVRFVFSGHPHPSDGDGQRLLAELKRLCDQYPDVAAYLPDYDMDLAKKMVAGTDVWLNTPVVGFEASGTSGMKAALNGSLPCSTRDGWVDEADLRNLGWILNNDQLSKDLYHLLESEILPVYYGRNADGVPEVWEDFMRNSRDMIMHRFTATRMRREYVEMLST
ncbi:MAG TPA: alpha-glucan family phosphorylase [Candidatus Eisenbacteria bacterium]|nr:alpha-glucan family phosphorylase [Candidatus Eisenbacteria bacterium]